jgi:hypothetical protein
MRGKHKQQPPATDVAGGCRYTRYLRHGTIRDEHKT